MLLLSLTLSLPANNMIYAQDQDTQRVNTRMVNLSESLSDDLTYEFVEKVDDTGQVIYGFKDVDVEDRKKAMDYINKKMSTVKPQGTKEVTVNNKPGKYSGNVYGEDSRNSNAQSYSFVNADYHYNTWTVGFDATGGQSGGWFGTGSPTQIVFNESVTYSGVTLTIGWPPSATGSSTSKSWSSQPVTNLNPAGSSHADLSADGVVLSSVQFVDTVDVYVNGQIYKPTNYIKFSIL